ncbi:MAG: ABC transporter ATP-binding protein [Saprospiraceae bacterium]|nr:ABC transporter ATP-binding protein [Saprospiraceae bacterium]
MAARFFEISQLTKTFGGITALDDLGLAVNRGEIFSIIGPNGAGKSTLFNCINGLYAPDSGQINFQGVSLRGLRPDQVARRRIARTFQNLELFSHMSTMDNLLLGRHLHMRAPLWQLLALPFRRSAAAREETAHRRKVEEVIDFLELQAVRDQLVTNLPYGKQKLVELGRALAMEPELILLDEPAAGLNQEEREEMVFWIRDIRDHLGITVLLIEHNMQMVSGISDRVMAISFGKKLAEGSVEEVLNHPRVVEAYIGG